MKNGFWIHNGTRLGISHKIRSLSWWSVTMRTKLKKRTEKGIVVVRHNIMCEKVRKKKSFTLCSFQRLKEFVGVCGKLVVRERKKVKFV